MDTNPLALQTFIDKFSVQLDSSRAKRAEELASKMTLQSDAEYDVVDKLERADRLMLDMITAALPKQRTEKGENGDRFCFTLIPTEVNFSYRDDTPIFSEMGPLFMHASKQNGTTDYIKLESTTDSRTYRNFRVSQAFQPSRMGYPAINTWKNGGQPPAFGSNSQGMSDSLTSRAEALFYTISDYASAPSPYLTSTFFKWSVDNMSRNQRGLSVAWLRTNTFYGAFGFDKRESGKLAKLYEKSHSNAIKQLNDNAYQHRRQVLKEKGVAQRELPDYVSERFLNYLVSAPTAEVTGYRLQVANIIKEKLYPGSALSDIESHSPNQIMPTIERVLCPSSNYLPYNVSQSIDAGAFPAKEIAKSNGFDALSKKQFNDAMRMFGLHTLRSWKDTDALFPRSLNNAMALTKIPAEWLAYSDNVPSVHPAEVPASFDFDPDVSNVMKAVLPFLIATGKQLDTLVSEGDKIGQKKLAQQWSWLSKGKGTLHERVRSFDEQYEIRATHKDYGKIMNQLLSVVAMRMIDDCDSFKLDDVLVVDDEDSSVMLDIDEVQRKLFDIIDKDNAGQDLIWEDEDGEIYYDEPERATDYLPPLTDIDIQNELCNLSPDILTLSQKNQTLHKEYNDLISHANRNSKMNISWESPFAENAAQRIGFYDVKCINDRSMLLEEGREMAHCVFSYVGKLAQGESIVFSVREPEHQSRLATIMFNLEYNDEGNVVLEFDQCFGPHNSYDNTVQAIEQEMKAWMAKVNAGEIDIDLKSVREHKCELDIEGDIVDNPSQYAALTSPIAFNEDGAIMAYFALENYTPQGQSAMDLLRMQSHTWDELFFRSGLKETVEQVQSLANKYNVSTIGIITLKQQLPKNITFSSPVLGRSLMGLLPVIDAMSDVVIRGQSRDVRASAVENALNARFEGHVALTAEAKKLLARPDPDLMAIAALVYGSEAPYEKPTLSPELKPKSESVKLRA